ncbi:pyocin S6 family toxin immunity protein [Pseudomonas chlororaphis]|uniref:pyocin S6 family toxin immunity protein n=1 Tax=Pseudomonas chlororaphis TaxID=587753 RepID=UPI0035D4C09C
MFLWISGFLKGDEEDDSLKFELTVKPEAEAAVLALLGWESLEESEAGEWLLNDGQVRQIASVLNEYLPTELDLFIGVRE